MALICQIFYVQKNIFMFLISGNRYTVTVKISLIGNDQIAKQAKTTFTAEIFRNQNDAWKRNLILGVVIPCVCLVTLIAIIFFIWYRRRKNIREFLHRERIDASELNLISKL